MHNPKLTNDISLFTKKRRYGEKVLYVLIYGAGLLTAALLAGILCYVAVRGAGLIDFTFLFTIPSSVRGTFGILGYMINTLYIIILTLLIATPIGIGAAVYLNEYAKRGKLVQIIEFATETLAGIPSIIYGLFGMVFFGVSLALKFSILCGALTLTLMILPTLIRTAQEALKAVPDSYRQGALAMGATKWYIIRTILLPSSLPGIVTGVILSMGRIVGESAALLFTAGSGYLLPRLAGMGLFEHIMDTGGTLTIGLYLNMAQGKIDNAFGIALVLVVIVLVMNLLTNTVTKRLIKNK